MSSMFYICLKLSCFGLTFYCITLFEYNYNIGTYLFVNEPHETTLYYLSLCFLKWYYKCI